MPYNRDKHHRRSIRLQGYDYTQAGAYFVTIVAQGKQSLFGQIAGDDVQLNDAGRMIQDQWQALSERFANVVLDTFVVMPNHFHGIVVILGGGEYTRTVTEGASASHKRSTLGRMIGAFKSLSTNAYIHGVHETGWPPFNRRLWQRNYYERIIRDESELSRVRQYIAENPARWAQDRENPNHVS